MRHVEGAKVDIFLFLALTLDHTISQSVVS